MLKNKLYVYGEGYLQVPADCNYGKEMLTRMLKYKDNTAIINAATGDSLSYSEFAQQVVDIALSLAHMGVKKGEVVSICSESRMENLPTIIGCICAGATYSPIDPTSGEATFLHRLNISKPSVVFCSHDAYTRHGELLRSAEHVRAIVLYGEGESLDGVLDSVTTFRKFLTRTAPVTDFMPTTVDGWTDNAFIIFSSGTTGLPKGIPLTHFNFLAINRPAAKEELYLGVPMLNTREWYYSYGLIHTLACLHVGSTVVFSPTSCVEDMIENIEKYKIKIIQICPMTVNQLVKSPALERYDVSSLQYMLSTSTPCRRELVVAAERKFPNLRGVVQLYGMSEAGGVCSELDGARAGSVGRVMSGVVVKVVDLNTRKPLGPDQPGEICIKSLGLMKGYLGDCDEDWMDDEGFYKTGDVGYYDEDRYFYVVDRVKEMIKYYDISVAPAEFEAILLTHPTVVEAGVIGAPHEEAGEEPVAFVVLRPEATVSADELVEYVNKQMSSKTQLVGGVRFVDKLPRIGGSKLDRKTLKMMLQTIFNN